ncbi:MAG TPA: hypothetical protein DEH78_32985, partial [Solibacterales bacterium]|nr:hypothetical protein [Bryobacterales bacterium]
GRYRTRRTHGVDIVVHAPAEAKEVGRFPLVDREDPLPLRNESTYIGNDGRRLWFFADRLYGLEPRSGALTGTAAIEAVNPFLAGQWLPEHKYYTFDEASRRVQVLTAEGRHYALDAGTLKALPTGAPEEAKPKDMQEYAALVRRQEERYDVLHNGVKAYWRPRARLRDNVWSGLLTEEEAGKIRAADNWEEPRQGHGETEIRRFWVVRLKPWVDRWREKRLKAETIEEAPGIEGAYLQGGVVRSEER